MAGRGTYDTCCEMCVVVGGCVFVTVVLHQTCMKYVTVAFLRKCGYISFQRSPTLTLPRPPLPSLTL